MGFFSFSCKDALHSFQIQRDIIAIPKSATKNRVIANINIFDFALDAQDMKTINDLNRDYRIAKMDFADNHKYYPFHDEY